ncbi:MAG TPA: LacI family DNA-binding transcriptional regulator [Verrucomicrobiae bacterium]|nr:LacI family DNA-binding transcriptional regulator [Verrucomicrobiae bacterium]
MDSARQGSSAEVEKNPRPETTHPRGRSHPTLHCLAERSGLSVTTISRVLSGQADRYRISKETEAEVRKIARELNFVPNQLARGLRLKKTLNIGLVIPDVSNPFFAGIARQVTVGARRHEYSVVLCDSQDSVEMEIRSLALLQSQHIEGVVLCPVGQSGEHLARFLHGKMPLVLVDRYFPDLAAPFVSSDNVSAAREATEHLLANGHRRIACLQGLPGTSPNDSRLQGYKEALAKHQVRVDDALIVGDSFTEQSGYIETKLLLRNESAITAILALSNLNALGCIRALAEEKKNIPDDVSLISFDDPPYAPFLATPLTSIAQSYSEMGDVAVKLLFDQIQSGRAHPRGGILIPSSLVTRKSVKQIKPLYN